MAGGLVVLGFLFLTFVFRSVIVGDLASEANVRHATPRVELPDRPPAKGAPLRVAGFQAAREAARGAADRLDDLFLWMAANGADARILESRATRKHVRVYRCMCDGSGAGCERTRGLLAGAFEKATNAVVRVHETRCRKTGAPHCEFEIHHAALLPGSSA